MHIHETNYVIGEVFLVEQYIVKESPLVGDGIRMREEGIGFSVTMGGGIPAPGHWGLGASPWRARRQTRRRVRLPLGRGMGRYTWGILYGVRGDWGGGAQPRQCSKLGEGTPLRMRMRHLIVRRLSIAFMMSYYIRARVCSHTHPGDCVVAGGAGSDTNPGENTHGHGRRGDWRVLFDNKKNNAKKSAVVGDDMAIKLTED